MKTTFGYVAMLLCVMACQKKEEKTTEVLVPISETIVTEVDSIPNKKGEYVVTEEVFWVMQEEPGNHFDKAHKNLVTKEIKAAAVEIRKATAYMGYEISRASNKEKELLQASKNTLDSLATRLEAGENVKEAELKDALYKANLALYKNFRAQYDHLQADTKQISSYLDAALKKVENTEKWSGKKLKTDIQKVVLEGKQLSNRLKTDLKEDEESAKKEWNVFKEKLKDLDAGLEGNANN